MRVMTLVSLALLVPSAFARGQSSPSPVGVANVGGVDVPFRCIPVPEGGQRFYVEVAYANSDMVSAPDLPAYAVPIAGLVPQVAGISNGCGSGDPIGQLTFQSMWSGYQPGVVIAAKQDVFAAGEGDLYADELFAPVAGTTMPNMTFLGAFTFTGGAGPYEHASGSAASVAQQLGDGIHSVFVACGWIEGIRP